MRQLEQMARHLAQFLGEAPAINDTAPTPGSFGLFPLGTKRLSQTENVLGQRRVRFRSDYLLRLTDSRGYPAAQKMQALAYQIDHTASPWEHIAATGTHLAKSHAEGIGTYEMTITLEYTEEMEYGEN